MRTTFSILAILLMSAAEAFSQDYIHTIDSRPVKAQVFEIGEDFIWYKAFDNPEGPDYKISTSRVVKIVFDNGTTQYFGRNPVSMYRRHDHYYDDDYYGALEFGPLAYRWGRFYDSQGYISREDLADYIGVSLYGSEYLKAASQYTWGLWLTVGGAAAIISSAISHAMKSDFDRWGDEHGFSSGGSSAPYVTGYLIGAGCLGAGIPLWVKGSKGLHRIADDYNANYGSNLYGSRTSGGRNSSLTLGPTRSGVGLALNF